LKNTLRPELLNRIDDIVIFRSLTRKDARKIVKLLIKELNVRLAQEKVSVTLDSKAITYIVKEGFSEEYGARPIKRLLQDTVENAVANYLLEKGKIGNGLKNMEIKIGMKDNKISVLNK
jgi:ATP-dependent Clp protease ATP-binding subunit ClpC